MGWKNVKEHYRIGHIVQVTAAGICIGSPYIHDLIVIGLDGVVKKTDRGPNEDLIRYDREFTADPDKLAELVKAPDTFSASLPVFTYENGDIVEKVCEVYGWPNLTHDGEMMYENHFSASLTQVVVMAKKNALVRTRNLKERIEEKEQELRERVALLEQEQGYLAKLNADYPGVVVSID